MSRQFFGLLYILQVCNLLVHALPGSTVSGLWDAYQPFHDLKWELFDAVENKDIQRVQQLIQQGANVNAVNSIGETVLMHEVMIAPSNLEILKILIDAGADVNALDSDGWCPIIFAVVRRNSVGLKYLLDAGANPNLRTNHESTALLLASPADNFEAVEMLVSAGAYIDQRGGLNSTALIAGVIHGHNPEVVKYLLNAGANVNLQTDNGSTALMFAAQRNDLDLIKLLLDFGADKYIINNRGLSASQLEAVNEETRDLLRNYEPNFAIKR